MQHGCRWTGPRRHGWGWDATTAARAGRCLANPTISSFKGQEPMLGKPSILEGGSKEGSGGPMTLSGPKSVMVTDALYDGLEWLYDGHDTFLQQKSLGAIKRLAWVAISLAYPSIFF